MMRNALRHMSIVFPLLFVCLPSEISWAQNTSIAKPPVLIGGFSHKFYARGRVHMNICRNQTCVTGSKVSYVIYPPTDNPDFEEFKRAQKIVLSRFQSRARQGVVITSENPERTQDQQFTFFTNIREMHSPNGSKVVTKSTNMFDQRYSISLISSSKSKETAESNSAQFMLGLILWSRTQKKYPK